MPAANRLTRFSDRVENYIKYRPRYPDAVLEVLREHTDLTSDAIIADIGSGTGIFSEQLLGAGQQAVIGVEPNDAMRAAAEDLLAQYTGFQSINGTSEVTHIASHSVDLIVAAQAFHWFDPIPTRQEFRRILKPNGWVALLWNARFRHETPFMAGYTALLETYCPDYKDVEHGRAEANNLVTLYGTAPRCITMPNAQYFDFEQLKGRFLSSSYSPKPNSTHYSAAMRALTELFAAHAQTGQIAFEYTTKVYLGQVSK